MRALSVFILTTMATAAFAAEESAWRRAMFAADDLEVQGRLAEAEVLLRAALPDAQRAGDAATAFIWNSLGSLSLSAGRCEEARASYQRSAHSWEKVVEGYQREKLRTAVNLAVAYLECGEIDHAEQVHKQLIVPNVHWLPAGSTDYARYLGTAADIEFHRGRGRKAVEILRTALTIWDARDPRNPQAALALNNLAVVEVGLGEHRAAEEHANRAFAILQTSFPREHVMMIKAYNNQATIQYMLGHKDEAARLLREALDRCEGLRLSNVIRLNIMENYRVVLQSQKRKQEAKRVAADIKAIQSGAPGRQTVDVRELSAFR